MLVSDACIPAGKNSGQHHSLLVREHIRYVLPLNYKQITSEFSGETPLAGIEAISWSSAKGLLTAALLGFMPILYLSTCSLIHTTTYQGDGRAVVLLIFPEFNSLEVTIHSVSAAGRQGLPFLWRRRETFLDSPLTPPVKACHPGGRRGQRGTTSP